EVAVDLEAPVMEQGTVEAEEGFADVERVRRSTQRAVTVPVERIAILLLPPAADVQITVAVAGFEMESVREGRLELDFGPGGSLFLLILEAQRRRQSCSPQMFGPELLHFSFQLLNSLQRVDLPGLWPSGSAVVIITGDGVSQPS